MLRDVSQLALVQSCLFEANSFKPVLKNQWLASPDFPDLCTLHRSQFSRFHPRKDRFRARQKT